MPPAEKATIARIGLVGQACAHASPFAKARARTDSNMKQIRVMPFSSYRGGHCVEDLSKGQQPVGFRAKDSTHRHGRLLHPSTWAVRDDRGHAAENFFQGGSPKTGHPIPPPGPPHRQKSFYGKFPGMGPG